MSLRSEKNSGGGMRPAAGCVGAMATMGVHGHLAVAVAPAGTRKNGRRLGRQWVGALVVTCAGPRKSSYLPRKPGEATGPNGSRGAFFRGKWAKHRKPHRRKGKPQEAPGSPGPGGAPVSSALMTRGSGHEGRGRFVCVWAGGAASPGVGEWVVPAGRSRQKSKFLVETEQTRR